MKNGSAIFLTILFPGYFFYHVAYSMGVVPYAGIFTITLGIAFIYFLAKIAKGLLQNPYPIVSIGDVFFGMLIVLITAVAAINHTLNNEAYIGPGGLAFSGAIIVSMAGFYLIGRSLDLSAQPNLGFSPWAVVLAYLACSIIFRDSGGGYMLLTPPDDSSSEPANYQGMARSVLYSMIFALPFIRSGSGRLIYSTLCVACLFLIGSRTDFALGMIVFVVSMFSRSSLRGATMIYGAMLLTMPLAMYFLYTTDRFSINSNDPSLVERATLNEASFNGIANSPILGDYLGQVRDFGEVGSYAHNALSMYQQFGAAPFIAYIAFISFSLLIAIKSLAINRRSPYTELLLHLSVVALAGVLVAKSILWTTPVLAWGLAVGIMRNRYACIRP